MKDHQREDNNHYRKGMPEGVEAIDIIKTQGFGFFDGNALKYLLRYKWKGTPLQDLIKLRDYTNQLIQEVREAQVKEAQEKVDALGLDHKIDLDGQLRGTVTVMPAKNELPTGFQAA